MSAGRCTFAAMCYTFPHLGSRGRVLLCSRDRMGPRRSLFESREYFRSEISNSFELQKSIFGRILNSFLAYCRGGLEEFDPLLQFRTRACPILGLLPLEDSVSTYTTSSDFAAY